MDLSRGKWFFEHITPGESITTPRRVRPTMAYELIPELWKANPFADGAG
jgi:hypothetical protein